MRRHSWIVIDIVDVLNIKTTSLKYRTIDPKIIEEINNSTDLYNHSAYDIVFLTSGLLHTHINFKA